MGFTLFAPAAIMFLLALQWGGNDYPWSSSVVIGLFCGAGVTAILFILWERHMGERAMLPGSIIKQRVVWSSAINGMALMAIIFTGSQYLPVYFQSVRGEGPAMSGVDMLPGILSQLFMIVMSGILIQKVGYYLPFSVASGAVSAVGNGLVSTYTPWTETAKWAGYQILLGSGRGLGLQTVGYSDSHQPITRDSARKCTDVMNPEPRRNSKCAPAQPDPRGHSISHLLPEHLRCHLRRRWHRRIHA